MDRTAYFFTLPSVKQLPYLVDNWQILKFCKLGLPYVAKNHLAKWVPFSLEFVDGYNQPTKTFEEHASTAINSEEASFEIFQHFSKSFLMEKLSRQPHLIALMDNPPEYMQLEIVRRVPFLISTIQKPTQNTQELAVELCGYMMLTLINNPSEATKQLAMRRNFGHISPKGIPDNHALYFSLISDPSEDLINLALDNNISLRGSHYSKLNLSLETKKRIIGVSRKAIFNFDYDIELWKVALDCWPRIVADPRFPLDIPELITLVKQQKSTFVYLKNYTFSQLVEDHVETDDKNIARMLWYALPEGKDRMYLTLKYPEFLLELEN